MRAFTLSVCLAMVVGAAISCSAEDVRVATGRSPSSFPETFMSFTMDAGTVGRWGRERGSFFYNESVINLAKDLSPCFFRFGGTGEDFTSCVAERVGVAASHRD